MLESKWAGDPDQMNWKYYVWEISNAAWNVTPLWLTQTLWLSLSCFDQSRPVSSPRVTFEYLSSLMLLSPSACVACSAKFERAWPQTPCPEMDFLILWCYFERMWCSLMDLLLFHNQYTNSRAISKDRFKRRTGNLVKHPCRLWDVKLSMADFSGITHLTVSYKLVRPPCMVPVYQYVSSPYVYPPG